MKKALLIVCAVVCSMLFASAQQSSEQVSKVKQSLKSIDWTPRYKGEVNIGYSIAGQKFKFDYTTESSDEEYEDGVLGKYKTGFSRPLIETIHGVEFGPYLFVGAGLGLQYYCGKLKEFYFLAEQAAEINETKTAKRWNAVMLPIFADIKFMYPINKDLTPFLNLGLGGTVACFSSVNCTKADTLEEYGVKYSYEISQKARGGFYCDFGAGLRYKSLNCSLGLQHQIVKLVSKSEITSTGEYSSAKEVVKTAVNSFYLKVGFNF